MDKDSIQTDNIPEYFNKTSEYFNNNKSNVRYNDRTKIYAGEINKKRKLNRIGIFCGKIIKIVGKFQNDKSHIRKHNISY